MTALAYVFWHWPRPETKQAAYEQRLADFHRALQAAPPAGFLGSVVYRLPSVPWLEAPGPVYEDWYLMSGSVALDALNDAALALPYAERHDRVAGWAAGGAAGLYRLRAGSLVNKGARWAYWLQKPAGLSYAAWYAMASPLTGRPGVSLWGRQMVLGPTPEFCLLTPSEITLPAALGPTILELEPIWPSDR